MMPTVIRACHIPFADGEVEVFVPAGGVVLSVGDLNGMLMLYVRADQSASNTDRRKLLTIRMSTFNFVPEHMRFIGTVIQYGAAIHIFEVF